MFGITFKMAKGLSSLFRVCYTFNWHIWHLKLVNGLKCPYILGWKVQIGRELWTYGCITDWPVDLWIG